jgi:hypothetical protein
LTTHKRFQELSEVPTLTFVDRSVSEDTLKPQL